jgi:hypothetical protein
MSVEMVPWMPPDLAATFLHLPVPRETMQATGWSGHKALASWIATPVGLLQQMPPSVKPMKLSVVCVSCVACVLCKRYLGIGSFGRAR